jgi:hypothetical protein
VVEPGKFKVKVPAGLGFALQTDDSHCVPKWPFLSTCM